MTLAATISEFERINRQYEKYYFPKVRKAISFKKNQLIEVLRSQGVEAARTWLSGAIGNEKLAAVIQDLYLTVGLRHARLDYSRMRAEEEKKSSPANFEQKGFGFNDVWTSFILNYFRLFLIQKITYDVDNTTREKLMNILNEATLNGWSIDQTVDKVEGWDERYQAATIVRTETNRAANVGHKANSETLPYQQVKEWVSAQDRNVRGRKPHEHANHWELNGVKIDAEDKFVDPINGDQMDFPGDITASAESTINCRCRAVYTAKRDSMGNLIPKRRSTFVQFPGERRPIRTVVV